MAKVNLKFDELKKLVWAGAVDNMLEIERAGKVDEFMNFLDEILDSDSSVDMIKVNDIIWFDFDYICESIGIETEAE